MRISFILPSLSRRISGGEKVVFEYANYMANRNDEVVIYYMVDKCLSKYPIPHIIAINIGRMVAARYPVWFKLSDNIRVKGVYRADQVAAADVVVATAVRTSFFVDTLREECGKKAYFIQDFENWSFTDDDVYKSYELGMFNIVISRWLKNIVEDKSGKHAFYVSNGIDDRFFFTVNSSEKRESHTLAFHYRSEPGKGAMYAIEVVKKLKSRYNDLKVYVIGRENCPETLPTWCKYIQNASMQEVANINNMVSVFLCTSISEGFGLPGLEAMACGCALVTTAYLGAMEYAIHEKNSLIAPVGDIDTLVDSVSRLFDNDVLRSNISKEASVTGKEHSLRNSARKFRNVIEKIYEKDKCKINEDSEY